MESENSDVSAGFSLQEYLGILRRRRAIILQAFVIITVVGTVQALISKNIYEASSRNATTHGLFARDVVLPSLGEDPAGYHQLEAEWMAQLPPRTLLERHYVEKIAAASWRLRRLHRWQAQIFEDPALTEDERLTRLDKVLRHETALHRQIDTAVKMLAKDAPHLYAQRVREEVLAEARIAAREYQDIHEDAVNIDLRIQDKMYRIRKATEQAANELSIAPLDTAAPEDHAQASAQDEEAPMPSAEVSHDTKNCQTENCQNELPSVDLPAPASFQAPPTWTTGAWHTMTPEKMSKRTRAVLP